MVVYLLNVIVTSWPDGVLSREKGVSLSAGSVSQASRVPVKKSGTPSVPCLCVCEKEWFSGPFGIDLQVDVGLS